MLRLYKELLICLLNKTNIFSLTFLILVILYNQYNIYFVQCGRINEMSENNLKITSLLNKKRSEFITNFNFPSWLNSFCPSCNDFVYNTHLYDISIPFYSSEFGNISVYFLCSNCTSLFEIIYQAQIRNVDDISKFFSSETCPCKVVSRKDLSVNNLLEDIRVD